MFNRRSIDHRAAGRALFTLIMLATVVRGLAQEVISVARGGGITGRASVFRLSRTGEVAVSRDRIEPHFTEFAHLPKREARRIFRRTRALFKGAAFHHPGDRYVSISLTRDGKEGKMVWGDAAHEPPAEAIKLYNQILQSLERLSFSSERRQ